MRQRNGKYKEELETWGMECTSLIALLQRKKDNEWGKDKSWVRISKLMKDTNPQTQEILRINKNKSTPS